MPDILQLFVVLLSNQCILKSCTIKIGPSKLGAGYDSICELSVTKVGVSEVYPIQNCVC